LTYNPGQVVHTHVPLFESCTPAISYHKPRSLFNKKLQPLRRCN